MPKAKRNELSSREDFIVDQFATMKKINTMASKLFHLYYIDTDPRMDLSPMMRNMVPRYWVDPIDPEHPGCYILAGQSNIDYLERMVFITPFVDGTKYAYDLSAWKGLLINSASFTEKAGKFRKTKLEPMVIVKDHMGERVNQCLILRETDTSAKAELNLPFLHLPNRKRDGDEAYFAALDQSIYRQFYQYLDQYIFNPLPFKMIDPYMIEEILDKGIVDIPTDKDDVITMSKALFPTVKLDHRFKLARVPNPLIDTSGGRYHFILAEEYLNDSGVPYITIYTLMAALQINTMPDKDPE